MKKNSERRIGLAERTHALKSLEQHHKAGRVTFEEFDSISRDIANATTKAQLDRILDDLRPPRSRWLAITVSLGLVCIIVAVVVALTHHSSQSGQDQTVASSPPAPMTATTATSTPPAATSAPSTSPRSTTSKSNDAIKPVQYLTDFDVLSNYNYARFGGGLAYVSGTPYTKSLMMHPPSGEAGYVEYDLGRNFIALDGVLGVRDKSTPADVRMQFRILADGKVVYDDSVALGGSLELHLDMNQVLRLRLELTNLNSRGDAYGVFGDLRLTPRG